MWQAEVRVDLDAIRGNVARLKLGTGAEIMAVVKADGYGHGIVESARAALDGGATWLGVCTLEEARSLRRAGITAPVLAWLLTPGLPLHDAVTEGVDLSAGSTELLAEIVTAARTAGRPARTHLKVDTGLNRGGAAAMDWPALVGAAAKAEADGDLDVVGVWSHLACADVPSDPATTDRQLAAFHEALTVAAQAGLNPTYRHLANSAATLTRPDTHFDLVRLGIAIYGYSPVPGHAGLRPAMTARARVMLTKRVPKGAGVSYGHTYITDRETTLAVVPLGYADGIPRAASNVGPVWLAGKVRRIAGRVCMDQIVLDCGDDGVRPGDVAVLFGPGDGGEPTADAWAAAVDTISYEIVSRFGSPRVPRVYD